MVRKYRWKWTALIDRESLTKLQELAAGLGFFATVPGGKFGKPSPAAMLDALAAAYEVDPGGTHLTLKTLLKANDLLPAPAADNDDPAAG